MKKMKLLSTTAFRLLALMLCLAASVPQLEAQTYTVAGSDTQALGTSWSPSTNSNDMSLYSGNIYYLVKSVTYSSSTTYEYKITVNHSWGTSYGDGGGSSNASYSVNAGSGFTTYVFNSSTHVPRVVSSLQTVVIAGDDTQALGSSTWNGSNTANSMTTTDGITYTMTKAVDYTSSGNKQCKAVVAGNQWYGTSSNGNVYYNIPSVGSYTVTYTFNAVTGIVTVDVQSAAPVIPDYYVTGDNGLGLGGWSFNQLTTMTYDSNNDVYTYSYNVTTAGTYYFAFADGPGSDWNDFNGNHRYGPANGNEAVTLDTWTTTQKGGGSYEVAVDAGQVTITLDIANNRFKVEGTAPVITHDYYAMGDIFPNGWNTGNDTQMTETNGIYSWTSGQVHLDAGVSYEYKVYCSDGSYHPSGANATFSTNVAGTYIVKVTYDSNNNIVDAELTLVQEDSKYSYTFYVLPDDDTVTPYLYLWDSNNHPLLNAWPGNEMTTTEQLNDGNEWYKFEGEFYVNLVNAIANNGGNGHQTSDITNLAPGTYYIGWNVADNTYNISTDAPTPKTYYIEGSEHLGLTWTPAPTTEMTFMGNGIYKYTCTVDSMGTYGFVFANGTAPDDWDTFNATYRIGPTSGNESVALNGDWHSTQMAGSNNGGAYMVRVAPGTVNIYFDAVGLRYKVEGTAPTYDYTFYVLPSDASVTPVLYLWDEHEAVISDPWPGTQLTTTELLADGNTWHKWTGSLNVDIINAIVSGGGDDTKTKDITYIDPGTYYIRWNTTRVDNEEYNYYELYNVAPTPLYSDLFLHGSYSHEGVRHNYSSSDGTAMKYDANTGNYYLNNVTLSSNATFCFSEGLGADWSHAGTRYGNGGSEYTDIQGGTNYLGITSSKINKNLPLDLWSETYGEYMMLTAGVYNMLVNPTEKWVKLIKTDHAVLSPMNVYLEQTENVQIDNIQEPNTTYTAQMFGDSNWPLCAYNRREGNWDPNNSNMHYNVTYLGDTTTVDGKTWWHWEVTASICEIFFNRTNKEPNQSETIERRSGVLWHTWDEVDGQTVMTDHTREYFEASANALPTNAVVMEGHYYVYFINTLGWENVYCNAWYDTEGSTYYDGYGRHVQDWPGQPCECVGIDPVTGYEVWRYDFGTIYGTQVPDGILFNDGNPDAQSDVKEQTGDFEYINGGVYDYLGLFDGAFTLNNLIRKAAEDVRYTVSNDLLAVYYDADAVTRSYYTDISGKYTYEDVQGALYAKDLNQYGEKSVMPDATYTDYVYGPCASTHTAGGSQIMDKKTTYDQSNWVKLVYSPNYDGGTPVPLASNQRPILANYPGHIIKGGTLEVFMTDTINPTAHILNIAMGEEMTYQPNVYVSTHFNDTIVFNYAHKDWQLGTYQGTHKAVPSVQWNFDGEGNVINGVVTSTVVEDSVYKMFYVAPKPQEIAYITWIVYDNLNLENENNIKPYGDYVSGRYSYETSTALELPIDPGRFYAPKNWNRAVTVDGDQYDDYLSGNFWNGDNNIGGGYGKEYGPYSNGYQQYGAIKVNWSLFDPSKSLDKNNSPLEWWQIFQPGQAYKIKAIIRYARGYDKTKANECYMPSNGYTDFEMPENNSAGSVLNAPRRADSQGSYPNMYFTKDYTNEGLNASKFIIFPIEASPASSDGRELGNVTTVKEVKTELTIVKVNYYNLMGVESSQPFDGINIVVTTYSDGSRTSQKILR